MTDFFALSMYYTLFFDCEDVVFYYMFENDPII